MTFSKNNPADLHMFSEVLKKIRRFVVPVMQTVLDRIGTDKTANGWIDMKINPENGEDRYQLNYWYRKEHIYSWIQGRGLETIVGYLNWIDGLKGYNLLDVKKLYETGDQLYRNLQPLLPDYMNDESHGSSLPFVFVDKAGYPALGNLKNDSGFPGISDLFVARGVVSYAYKRGFQQDLRRSVGILRYIVDSANAGELINDQIHYDGEINSEADIIKIGLEGPMLAIGAASILFLASGEKQDLLRGIAAIKRIMAVHTISIEPHGRMVLDFVNEDGSPYLENGVLQNNPGHALEIVGMALEFLRGLPQDLCTSEELNLCKTWKKELKNIGRVHLHLGRSKIGTIISKVQVKNGKPVKSFSPWWSSFEAVRTCSEMLLVSDSIEEKKLFQTYILGFMKCIDDVYIKPSKSGIPIQNVDLDGNIISIIPATPDIDPGYHTGIPLFDAYEILSDYSGLLCGMGSSKLSLEMGKSLQGHVARKKPAEAVMDPLFVRSCCLETAYNRTVFVSCDILELDLEWTDELYSEIEATFGVTRSNIILSTTHTHTGPCVLNLGPSTKNMNFLPALKHSVYKAVAKGFENLIPVSAISSVGLLPEIGVNRRSLEPVTKTVVMRPNPEGAQDKSLTTICFISGSGDIYGIMVNVSVHPTTLGVTISEYSGDYPGRIVTSLQSLYKNLEVIVFQGACGDVRPAITNADGTDFIDGNEEDIERMGQLIADEISFQITKSLEKYLKGVTTCGNLYTKSRYFDLQMDVPGIDALIEIKRNLQNQQEFQTGEIPDKDSFSAAHDDIGILLKSEINWVEAQIEKLRRGSVSSVIKAEFSICVLCENIIIITIPGEAFSQIGLNIKKIFNGYTVLLCGYSSGTIGYIPTKQAYSEGGYEVERAYRLYGFPGPLSSSVEEDIYKAVKLLLEEYHEFNK